VRERADEIEEAAVRWLWRIDREGRSPALDAALEAWLDGDSRRRGAFLHAEATWSVLDRAAQLDAVETPSAAASKPSRRVMLGLGGAVLAASAAGLAFLGLRQQRYDTKLGEIRRVSLDDGSTMALNTHSAVRIEMTSQQRMVKLAEGEAWFQVAKNRERPFVVEAGRVRVRAVGTAFSVRRLEGGAEILVTEGVVEAWREDAEGHRARLVAGDKAFIANDAGITEAAAKPSEIDRRLAWRSGQIDLAGETLGEAVEEFNRYNIRKLVVADAALTQERLYGVFRTDDPEGFARSVRLSIGAPVVLGETEIRIGASS
jgi:transmembrane sensor